MFCRLIKLQIDRAQDSGEALSPATREHLASCPDCRVYRERICDMGSRLRNDAGAASPAMPPHLIEATLAAVRQAARDNAPSQTPATRWRTAFMATAAALVLTAGLALHFYRENQAVRRENEIAMQHIGELRETLALMQSFGQGERALASVQSDTPPPTWQGLVDAPLTNELNRLQDDTKAIGRFVVDCLPIPLRHEEG